MRLFVLLDRAKFGGFFAADATSVVGVLFLADFNILSGLSAAMEVIITDCCLVEFA